MKPKNIVAVALLAFAIASVVYLIFKESGNNIKNASVEDTVVKEGPERAETRDKPQVVDETGHKVIAYYFHTTKRCPTCRKIEEYTTESIETGFAAQLKSGKLEFHVVNVDEPENRHYIDDYQLTTKSVVLADYRDGRQTRWKNLDRVWQYVRERQVFINYIEDETKDYLGELLNE